MMAASRWVESRCGAVAVGRTYLFPPLSSDGALVVRPLLVSTSRSSNRTCGATASGSRTRPHAFARSLPCGIAGPSGQPLELRDIVDFDLCWAFNLADPWGNQYELNCYDYDRIKTELIERDAITPVRYWPRELYDAYTAR